MTDPHDLTQGDPAQWHREIAEHFHDIAEGVADWQAPAPPEGWAAIDVVRHLIEWLPGFLAGAGVEVGEVADVDEDPPAAWRQRCEDVQALLDDPTTAERSFANPHTGEMPLATAITRFYTADVLIHTWDLAKASGQEPALDDAVCAGMADGMEPIADMLASSGQYGPRVPVPADASGVDRLMGLVGRDPAWAPR
ncbi:MAG: TIGR03086 family protein [Micrococcales bacterium]|nr:TIGR03086 family protein [Micrococcales bacterium]